MSNLVLQYPFDLTGNLAATAVRHKIVLGTGSINRAFAFPTGPFYVDTVRMTSANDPTKRWDIKTHWEPIFLHPKLTAMTGGREICLGIVVKSNAVPTDIEISAQIVGGQFASDVSIIEAAIAALELDNRVVDFSELKNLPETYAAAPSYRDMGDLFGMEYMIAVMSKLLDAVGASGNVQLEAIKALFNDLKSAYQTAINNHASASGNVHNLNIHQLSGLTADEIQNLITPVAHQIEATIQSINDLGSANNQTNARIDALLPSLQSISSAMSVVNNNYQKMVLIVANLQSDISTYNRQVQELMQQIANMRNELNETNARIDGLNAGSGDLSGELAAVRQLAQTAQNTANSAVSSINAHATQDDPHTNYLHKAKGGTVNAAVRVVGNLDASADVRAEN